MTLPVSHTVPSYPVSEQLQLKAPSKSSHRPLCSHGNDRHSLISASQFSPVYALAQIHLYSLIPSVHVPEFRHGLLLHSSMLIWQFTPLYPFGQLHVYILIPSIHVLLWMHGLLWHSLMLVWQLIPVYPAVQVHWYEPGVFLQDAPLIQNEALGLHSLTSAQDYSWTQYRYIHFCSSLMFFNWDISFRNVEEFSSARSIGHNFALPQNQRNACNENANLEWEHMLHVIPKPQWHQHKPQWHQHKQLHYDIW